MNKSYTATDLQQAAVTFKRVAGQFPTGVTVVTVESGEGQAYGLTVSSFTSVSLDPPLILVCLDNRLSGIEKFSASTRFAVNILAENQREVSDYFATPGSDRSRACGYYFQLETGAPRLRDCLAWMECRPESIFPGGDHSILVGRVAAVGFGERHGKQGPLVYFRGRYGQVHPDLSQPLELPDHKE